MSDVSVSELPRLHPSLVTDSLPVELVLDEAGFKRVEAGLRAGGMAEPSGDKAMLRWIRPFAEMPTEVLDD
jgi:hypothetical protein